MGQTTIGGYLLLLVVIVALAFVIAAFLNFARHKTGRSTGHPAPLRQKTTGSHPTQSPREQFVRAVFGIFIVLVALYLIIKKQEPAETETADMKDRVHDAVGQPEFGMVEPAPTDQQPELNPNYSRDKSMKEWAKTIILTPSGYPYMLSRADAPICTNPFSVKEAMDAWVANDRNWVENILGCTILPKGSSAEVTKGSYGFDTNTMEIRLKMSDGSRATFYGPYSTTKPIGIIGWYGYLRR
ncbi:hypothetical protein A8146_10115 [Mesorhizobium loti]|nr:hypothetical protein A8146_10115 [Mesorhizobium loti]